jgi:hypothetical protein
VCVCVCVWRVACGVCIWRGVGVGVEARWGCSWRVSCVVVGVVGVGVGVWLMCEVCEVCGVHLTCNEAAACLVARILDQGAVSPPQDG